MATTAKKFNRRRARLTNLQDRAQLLSAFGRRLAHLRSQSGLSPSEFEARSGIDAGNLAKYEQGNREPGLVVMTIMAKCLNVRLQELVKFDVDVTRSKTTGAYSSTGHESTKDPISLIRTLMKERNMRSKDLVAVLGVSKGLVSDILNYKKGLSKQSIKVLADYFEVDIALLYE